MSTQPFMSPDAASAWGPAASFNLTAALNAAPSLKTSPSLALAASTDQTPGPTAQTVGAAAEYNAASVAIKKVKENTGFLGKIAGGIGSAISMIGEIPGVKTAASTVANWMNKGEQNAQHEYRYLHDIFARHGFAAGMGELALMTAGGVAGGVAGFAVGGPVGAFGGAAAGANIAGTASQWVPGWGGSWDRTADGNKYNNGQTSFGRDVTSLIPWLSDKTTARHSIVSGLLDGVFDVASDPTLAAGKLNAGRKALDLTAVADQASVSALRAKLASTITLKDANSWDIAMQNSRVAAAVQKIADTTSPSDMRAILPRATDSEITQLIKAKTPDDVRQVYQDSLFTSNVLNKAPVLSLMSPISARLRDIGVKDPNASYALGQSIAAGGSDLSAKDPLIERMQRRFLTKLPLDADPTNPHPRDSFYLNGPNAGDIVHSLATYAYNKRVADGVRDAFLDMPDMTKRAEILGNVVKAAAWNMGFKDVKDPQFWGKFTQELDDHTLRGKGYGITDGRIDEGRINTPDRNNEDGTTSAAIWSSQTGRAAIPRFAEIRNAIADARSFEQSDSKLGKMWSVLNPKENSGFGFKADQFLYDHLTGPVFTRLALFSVGFAERIGLGEALYQGLGDGPVAYLKSQLAQSAAKHGYKVSVEDEPHRIAAAVAAGLHKLAPDETQTGFRLQAESDGHIQDSSTDANHIRDDTLESKVDSYSHNYKKIEASTAPSSLSDEFRSYDQNHEFFDYFYRKHLQDIAETPEGRNLAREYLDALDTPHPTMSAEAAATAEHAKFLQSAAGKQITANMDRGSSYALDNNGGYLGFAGAQMRSLLGATTGRNGELQRNLLESIRDGKTPSVDALNKMDRDVKPAIVPGLEISPNTDSGLDRLFNAGHHKVIAPIINTLSRNGTYIRNVTKEYQAALNSGVPEQDAWRLAQQRAVHNILPDIHNPNVRTQFSDLARNIMPFYFAQDQAYRRWGRLVQRNPEALREIQLLHQGSVNSGFVHKDPTTGQETFMYPMSGYVGGGLSSILGHLGISTLSGVPLSFSGNVSSLSSVTPFAELPGLHAGGPVVGLPLAALEAYAPETAPIAESAKGQKGSGASIADMIFPSAFLKNVGIALGADHQASFQSAQMQAMQTLAYQRLNGKSPDEIAAFLQDPHSMQKLIDDSKNYGRFGYMLKAIIGEGLPTQPNMQIGEIGLKKEFADLLAKSKTTTDAFAAFQKMHPGKDLTPFDVFQSHGVSGGNVPVTQDAIDFYEQHKDLLSSLPYGGAWLVPQVGNPSPDFTKVYNEQVAIGLRAKKSPEEFAGQLYKAAGDAQFYAQKALRDQAVAAVGPDRYAKQGIDQKWSAYQASLAQQNPVWASQQGSKVASEARARTLQEFSVLFDPANADKLPGGQQVKLVGDLYAQFRAYDAQRAVMSQPGMNLSADVKALDEGWVTYVEGVAKQIPQLAPVIQSVFRLVK